jgi:hypothetical protein
MSLIATIPFKRADVHGGLPNTSRRAKSRLDASPGSAFPADTTA